MKKLEFDEFVQRTIETDLFFEEIKSLEKFGVLGRLDNKTVTAEEVARFVKDNLVVCEGVEDDFEKFIEPESEAEAEDEAAEAEAEAEADDKFEEELKTSDESQYTFMQNDEEVKLLKLYRRKKNTEEGAKALETLINNKMPYVYFLVEKYLKTHPTWRFKKDDIVSDCKVELLSIIMEKFDPKKNVKLNWFVKRNLIGIIKNACNPERSKSVVAGKGGTSMISIDDKINGSRGEWADKDTSLGDIIPDPTPGYYEQDAEKEKAALAKEALNRIDKREAKILVMYFEQDKTFMECAKAIGIGSATGARKVLLKAVEDFKAAYNELMNE